MIRKLGPPSKGTFFRGVHKGKSLKSSSIHRKPIFLHVTKLICVFEVQSEVHSQLAIPSQDGDKMNSYS